MARKVREQIVEAASEVLGETGPAKMRVQEVARRAGVSPTLLYYYFDGKHDLVAAAYARDYEKILEQDRSVVEDAISQAVDFKDFTDITASLLMDQSAPERRKRRLATLAGALTDPAVADAIRQPNRDHLEMISGFLGNLIERGWLPAETDVHAMAIQWMAAPLGLVYGDLDPALSVGLPSYLASYGDPAPSANGL
jgi:AcrR family transcriptional regulator